MINYIKLGDKRLQKQKWDAVHERVLRQKSRATWIKYGDKNSKYFFAHLKARQARNNISSIYTEQGEKLTGPSTTRIYAILSKYVRYISNNNALSRS